MSRAGLGPFLALSTAILRGFLRDRSSVFFSLVFPLMFLVVFGGVLGDGGQSKVDLVQVGDVALFEELSPDLRAALDDTFEIETTDDRDAALEEVRRGDADVAVEMVDGTLVAHYTLTDQTKAAQTAGALRAIVDGTNVSALADRSGEEPPYALAVEQVEDESLEVIQYVTPGLLGWAVAMSASFGAASTLQGWRQSKLLRRLQLAPVSTRSVVAARVVVTVGIALVQMAVFVGLAAALFGLQLGDSWWMSVPLLVVGTLCFMALGLLAGAVTKTQEGAVNAANFMVLPMAFLSGSFFPLDGAPGWLQGLSLAMPLRHLNDGMIDLLVRGEGPSAVLLPIGVLAAFAVVVTLAAARLFRWETT